MLLHYAIRIVNKNECRTDSKELVNLEFKLTQGTKLEKIQYIVFGSQCQHLQNQFIDLADVVKGFNSADRQYQCPFCKKIYTEISDFSPHDLQQDIEKQFHPQTEKISVLYGQLFTHLKRNKKRFGDPLVAGGIKNEIKLLLSPNQDNVKYKQLSSLVMEDDKFKQKKEKFEFFSSCLLDNVNIVLPVRHKECNHYEAYELTSLIVYQIEYYKNLPQNMKNRHSNKYLKCIHKNCKAMFPLMEDKELLNSLIMDFEYATLIKQSQPGNLIYEAMENNGFKIQSLKNDKYIKNYWEKNVKSQEQTMNFEQFEKPVLEHMISVMNAELHKSVKEKINMFQYGEYEMLYLMKSQKNLDIDGKLEIKYPARCIHCEIPKSDKDNINLPVKNMDIRIFICYAYHQKLKAKQQNDVKSKFICPLCGKESNKVLAQMQINNELMYYDSLLYQRVTKIGKIILSAKDEFTYNGRKYLLENFQNVLKYTKANYIDDYNEYRQSLNATQNAQEEIIINFPTIKCSLLNVNLQEPILNFKCVNQTRLKFDKFYLKFRENNYTFGDGIKLCNCENDKCEKVTEIEGQLYYDEVYVEAYKKKEQHHNCDFGFSYNFTTQKFTEYKRKDEFVFIKLNPPVVRILKEEVEDSQNPLFPSKSFKQTQSIQQQE